MAQGTTGSNIFAHMAHSASQNYNFGRTLPYLTFGVGRL